MQLHIHVISSQCHMFLFFIHYLPDDGRKRLKHVGGLLYYCIYFCIELLCSYWNKHRKVILLHGTWMVLILFMYLVGCRSNSSIHKFLVRSKFVESNPYICEGVSVWCHHFVWKQASEVHPVHRGCFILHLSVGRNICFPFTYLHLMFS